jgi:acylphosphatase
MMGKTAQIFYDGRVQGVGFRFTVRRLAMGFDLLGFVRNLPDGRVEVIASGEGDEVDSFLLAVRESELAGHIENELVSEIPLRLGLRGFQIK